MSLPSRERGLKLSVHWWIDILVSVAPLAGAWIEIFLMQLKTAAIRVAPLAGAWIEIIQLCTKSEGAGGRSPRGSVD